jgi:hypothetical protein
MGIVVAEVRLPVDATESKAHREAATAEAEKVWGFYGKCAHAGHRLPPEDDGVRRASLPS